MSNLKNIKIEDENPTKFRLLSATLDIWERSGRSGISARQICEAAGATVSSIYHHFGSLEQLFVSAQHSACMETKAWCARQLEDIAGLPLMPAMFPNFFAGIVDDWTQEHRRLAFAWRESQMQQYHDSTFEDAATRWNKLWSDFWIEATAAFSLADAAPVVIRVFDNESLLHMIQWRRSIDRSALDEMAQGLGAWCCGKAIPRSPWREIARNEALRTLPNVQEYDEKTRDILNAAADIIELTGISGLTHRSVAEQAGVTLGVVSHKFRAKADLVQNVFETIYQRAVAPMRSGPVAMPADDPAAALHWITDFVCTGGTEIRATDELNVAAARDPSMGIFAVQLRYLRGTTSRNLLRNLVGKHVEITNLDAALFSGFISSQIRNRPRNPDQATRQAILRDFELIVALISARPRSHDKVTATP